MESLDPPKSFKAHFTPLFAGAIAGLSVDVTLYPLDTLKTRLQSSQGFQTAGGFRGVYRGLLTVATTSVPTASLFFVSYEATKSLCQPLVAPQYVPLVHMFAASVGEVVESRWNGRIYYENLITTEFLTFAGSYKKTKELIDYNKLRKLYYYVGIKSI